MAGLRLNLTAREMREVVSSQAREEERGFRRSQSREEKKMSFKEKGKWFHALKPANLLPRNTIYLHIFEIITLTMLALQNFKYKLFNLFKGF